MTDTPRRPRRSTSRTSSSQPRPRPSVTKQRPSVTQQSRHHNDDARGRMTVRARRRREEAVRALVSDVIQTGASEDAAAAAAKAKAANTTTDINDSSATPTSSSNTTTTAATTMAPTTLTVPDTHDWIVAGTVAAALEQGLDRELHTALLQQSKDHAGRIGQVCHDHADVFLSSVAQVAALATPSADVGDGLRDAQTELVTHTAHVQHTTARRWDDARTSHARARTLHVLVQACRDVAVQLEKGRKQAALGRPRAALEAVERARTSLAKPMESLFYGPDEALWKETVESEQYLKLLKLRGEEGGMMTGSSAGGGGESTMDKSTGATEDSKEETDGGTPDANGASTSANNNPNGNNNSNTTSNNNNTTASLLPSSKKLVNLAQTPFGIRAIQVLPRLEHDVLQSAKRGLNRWLTAQRRGDGVKVGRSALRDTAHSFCLGPGHLGPGGTLPASAVWRAQMADNWTARTGHSGKMARACRAAYHLDRDGPKDAERLETTEEGTERYAEAMAAAFGWYRCWEDGSSLLLDPAEYTASATSGSDGGMDGSGRGSSMSGSRHSGTSGLSGSRHGMSGSRHGKSRHGANSAGGSGGGSSSGGGTKGRSLGFRASTNSRSQAFADITTSTLGKAAATQSRAAASSVWAAVLMPAVLLPKSAARKEEDEMLRSLTESVHPVRRAEVAYGLLERMDEFIQYYEQNRFGEMKIGGEKDAMKSSLSALTGDDVTIGSDRKFFLKNLPHLCASIVGFSAVESALELSNFGEWDDTMGDNGEEEMKTATSTNKVNNGLQPSRFRDTSERYERALVSELGRLLRDRSIHANLGELVRTSRLLVAYRAALKLVHPSSTARRVDRDLLALDAELLSTAQRIAQDEQLKATIAVVTDDDKMPMRVSDALASARQPPKTSPGVPDPEVMGLPFGLSSMKQTPRQSELEFQEQSRTSYNQAPMDEVFTFSHCVPVILRSLHARAIACGVFALSQQELGQKFPDKKGSPAAAYVLDCVEECTSAAVIGIKDSDNVVDEGSVEKAVQVMANISAIQHSLPRFFGTVLRGIFHIGLVRAVEVDETFAYAEKKLKAADKACDSQVGSTYSLVYEICRTKIDSHINLALENFNWVAKSARETPNPYCEGLIGYLRTVFRSLGPMDEGSRAGLHFSCCGHVSERLVKLLSAKPGDTTSMDDSTLPPLTKIDAFGIKNLCTDCEEFERFADSTGIPSLRDCFSELRVLTSVLLDKELPHLLIPENAALRRRKYPILSLDKVANILDKYVGTGIFGGGAGRHADMLFIEKKEVQQLLKLIRSQH